MFKYCEDLLKHLFMYVPTVHVTDVRAFAGCLFDETLFFEFPFKTDNDINAAQIKIDLLNVRASLCFVHFQIFAKCIHLSGLFAIEGGTQGHCLLSLV